MPTEMFSYLADKNGNPVSEEELKRMHRQWLILLLKESIRKMQYLHEDDKRLLSFIAYSLHCSFKED